jgi:hypothetical protein
VSTLARSYRLHAENFDFWVDVRFTTIDATWVAVAELCGELVPGAGATPEDALRDAISSLGPYAVDDFVASAREQHAVVQSP